jgi:F-type H+-transporting ATPase subunit gamma
MLYNAFVQSQASEHASRMRAMKQATDNAGDIITNLTLEMNTLRQALITQEIAQIVGATNN